MGTSVSQILQVTTPAAGVPPGQIGNFMVTNVTSSSATLSWTAPTTGDTPIQYQPQFAPQGSSFINFGTPILATTVIVTGLAPQTAYNFQVLAENATGTSTSTTVSATTLAVLPNAPTGLAVVGTPTSNNVTLSFTAPTVGTTPFTYQVFYRTPSGSGNFVAGPTGTTTQILVAGLSPATSYDFEVSASNSAGTGPVSAVLSNVTTAAASAAPSAPGNVTISNITATGATVTWTASQGTTPITYTVQYEV